MPWQELFRESVDAESKLAKAKSYGTGAFFLAAFYALLGVAIGWHLFAIVGAIGGAVVGCFLGQFLIYAAMRQQKDAVAKAEAWLAETKTDYRKALNRKPIFTRSEARNGEIEEAPRAA